MPSENTYRKKTLQCKLVPQTNPMDQENSYLYFSLSSSVTTALSVSDKLWKVELTESFGENSILVSVHDLRSGKEINI